MKGFYKSNLGSNIQRFYTRIFILFYVSMLDYDLYSSPKNLIRVWEFRRLYDLSTSRELMFFKQLSLLHCEVLVFIYAVTDVTKVVNIYFQHESN